MVALALTTIKKSFSSFGKIIVITLAIILFTNTGAVLGVLGFLVAFDLIRRSSFSTGSAYALGEDFKMERITYNGPFRKTNK